MKNTAIVTTALAVFASEVAKHSDWFEIASQDKKMRVLGLSSALLEDRYDLLDDIKIHEEFEERFYESIVVPLCDLEE